MDGRPDSAGPETVAAVGTPASLDDLTAKYRESYPLLKKVATGMVGAADADDVVQEAYIVTADRIREGAQIENLGGWLFRVVKYQCLARLRAPAPQPFDEDLVGGDLSSTEELAGLNESCGEIYGAVGKLKPAQRSALLMAEVQGFNYAEIGERIGKTQNSVRLLLHRARTIVRDSVGFEGAPLAWPVLRHLRQPIEALRSLAQQVPDALVAGALTAPIVVVGVMAMAAPDVKSDHSRANLSPPPVASQPLASTPTQNAASQRADSGQRSSTAPPAVGGTETQPSSLFTPTGESQKPGAASDSNGGDQPSHSRPTEPADQTDPCAASPTATGCPGSDTILPVTGGGGGGGSGSSTGPLCPDAGPVLCPPPQGSDPPANPPADGQPGGPPPEGGGGGGGGGGGTPSSGGGGGGGG